MPTATILLRLLLLSFTLRPFSSTHYHHRRILHQPFQPQDSFPPSNPHVPSPPSPPDKPPFFPSYPSPPPPPPSPDKFSSLPANISSLSVPRPSRPNSASSKLIVAAVAAVSVAVAVVSLAVFLHIRRRTRNHGSSSVDQCKTQRSDNSSTVSFNPVPTAHRHIPKLQRPSQTSSELLYLGTLVSSHAPSSGGAAFNNVSTTSTTNYNNNNNASSNSRKRESPELRPLPPLNTHQGFRQNFPTNNGDVVSNIDDESEEFYSPKGSINGRESSIGTGSASRRDFAAIDVENFNESTSDSSSTYSSSVPGSGSGSPVRSVSLSLSPANNFSLRNSIPKSPDLIEIRNITLLPAGTRGLLFQESPSPSPPSSSSPEIYSNRSEESSPRTSNVSDHNTVPPVKISTAVRQNITAIPTPPEIGGSVFREPALALSSPDRYSKRSEESPPRISNISYHIVESPVRTSIPVKHNTIDIPTPPEKQGLVLPEFALALPTSSSSPEIYSKSSPRISDASDQNVKSPVRISSPLQHNTIEIPTLPPEIQGLMFQESASSPSTKSGQSSPRNSNADSPVRISSPAHNTSTFIPTSPELQDWVFPGYAPPLPQCSSSPERNSRNEESSPRISNVSDHNVESMLRISSPVHHKSPMNLSLPERYSTNQESSPRVSIDSDQSVEFSMRISSPPYPPPPPPPPPPAKKPVLPPAMINPLRPIVLESPTSISPIEVPTNDTQMDRNDEDKESPNKETQYSSEDIDRNGDNSFKLKLKPLHWDKVRASSDRETVWDQFKCSSFELDEEMIETLFVVNTPKPKQNSNEATRWQVLPSPVQDNGNRVLEPKKAQNIAILLKALHVTVDEVCEGLLEGNADILGTELLESLLKMAPTKEEERKLKEYKEDESPTKLGAAERFLKAVVDIPYAFKRVDAMHYISNFDSEVEYLKKSFATLEAACEELRSSRMFLKLLEAVLKTGNRMNVGTNRGDAHAFKLDTLLKLVDVKGTDGKTTLLHFVVQEIIRTEGARLSSGTHHENSSLNDDAKCRKLGLQVVSALSSELSNVKKAAVMDAEVLNSDVSKLLKGIENVREIIITLNEENSGNKFLDNMSIFMKRAEEENFRVRAQESVSLSLVKEITEYFHGNSAKEEAHPFRIFMVVREFLAILDRVCKEVGMINERTMVSSAHKFPVPVNPMLQQVSGAFHKRESTLYDDDDDDDESLHP